MAAKGAKIEAGRSDALPNGRRLNGVWLHAASRKPGPERGDAQRTGTEPRHTDEGGEFGRAHGEQIPQAPHAGAGGGIRGAIGTRLDGAGCGAMGQFARACCKLTDSGGPGAL